MKKTLLCLAFSLLVSFVSKAQINVSFSIMNDGYYYAVLQNGSGYNCQISWAVINDYKNQSKSGNFVLGAQPALFGPNTIGWYWEPGERFVYYVNGYGPYSATYGSQPSFRGENSDGYIPAGKISLKRTISGSRDTFSAYTKGGGTYVKYGGAFYRVDGYGTVTIGSIKYDKL